MYAAGFPLQNPFGIIKHSFPRVAEPSSQLCETDGPQIVKKQYLVPKQGVKPTLLPTHLSKPTISSTVGGCGGMPRMECLTDSMSFCSRKPRIALQCHSPKKMDKGNKDLMNSLGRSPNPPSTSREASCQNHRPGRRLLLPDSCNQGAKKYSAIRQKAYYPGVLTPEASSISEVSAKSNSFFYRGLS